MDTILKNVSAIAASRQLGFSGTGLLQIIEQLTASRRIDQDSDDAGLALRDKLSADIRIAFQGKRNARDGVSYLQVAYNVLSEVRNLLAHAAELSQQAQVDSVDESMRVKLDAEFQDIIKTITEIGQNTKVNGINIFGASLCVAAGDFGTVNVSVGAISLDDGTMLGITPGATALTRPVQAASAITNALKRVIETRASLSASMKQLTALSNALGIQVESLTAACGQTCGANTVDQIVNLIKWQLLHLSGTSAVNEANRVNQLQQQLLALFNE